MQHLCKTISKATKPSNQHWRLLSTETSNRAKGRTGRDENADKNTNEIIDGFRVFEPFKKSGRELFVKRKPLEKAPVIERYKKMPVDQDWTNVWPTSSVFRQSVVPLPINQGHVKNLSENQGVAPGKYANAELMKIPNFLHLTPAHIKKHCAVLKKFCTPWPKELKTDEDCRNYFPVEIQTTDYIYAGPSIRDERSRIVTLKIHIDSLELDEHARDKLIRLAENRYDAATGIITITSDFCPYRKQNLDYVNYLLTALYFESWNIEDWEYEMTENDLSTFKWDKSKSKEIITKLIEKIDKSKLQSDTVQKYAQTVEDVFNKGETKEQLDSYKNNVLQLFGLDKFDDNTQKKATQVST